MFDWIDLSRTTPLFWMIFFFVLIASILAAFRLINPYVAVGITLVAPFIFGMISIGAWGVLIGIVAAPAAVVPILASVLGEAIRSRSKAGVNHGSEPVSKTSSADLDQF